MVITDTIRPYAILWLISPPGAEEFLRPLPSKFSRTLPFLHFRHFFLIV